MRGGEAHPFMTVKVERTLPRPRFGGEGTLSQQHCPPEIGVLLEPFSQVVFAFQYLRANGILQQAISCVHSTFTLVSQYL
jgi:hypothetical protein